MSKLMGDRAKLKWCSASNKGVCFSVTHWCVNYPPSAIFFLPGFLLLVTWWVVVVVRGSPVMGWKTWDRGVHLLFTRGIRVISTVLHTANKAFFSYRVQKRTTLELSKGPIERLFPTALFLIYFFPDHDSEWAPRSLSTPQNGGCACLIPLSLSWRTP